MRRKNAESVWIMARKICQTGVTDREGGFLSVSGDCATVLANCFAAAVGVAVFEGTACNSSSCESSCCCCCCCSCSSPLHAGSVHVESCHGRGHGP